MNDIVTAAAVTERRVLAEWFKTEDLIEVFLPGKGPFSDEVVAYLRYGDLERFAPYATRVSRGWWIRHAA